MAPAVVLGQVRRRSWQKRHSLDLTSDFRPIPHATKSAATIPTFASSLRLARFLESMQNLARAGSRRPAEHVGAQM
jgi:hypothetical protein